MIEIDIDKIYKEIQIYFNKLQRITNEPKRDYISNQKKRNMFYQYQSRPLLLDKRRKIHRCRNAC